MSFSATYIYEILDRYSPVLRKISSVTDKFSQKSTRAGASLKKMGSRLAGVSTGLANLRTMVAAAGFTRGFINVTNSAFEFQKSLNAVEARTFGTTQEMKKLEKQALSLGASTIFTSVQVADGMKFLAQTGFETNEIFGLMPKMLTLAAAGDLQLAEAADIATNVLKTFGLEISDMGRVTDVLALAASSSNTDIRQLSMAIRNVGSVAKGVGVDIEEVAALIGVLGDKGIQAGQAGTLLMNAFRVVATEAPKVQKGLRAFGLKRDDVLTEAGKFKDFTGLLQVLGEKGATVGQLFDIFSIRGGKAVMALKDSTMSVRELNAALDEATGTGGKMQTIMLKHGVKNIITMQSAWQNLKITIGIALRPVTIWMADMVTKMSRFVSENRKLSKTVGVFLLVGSALSVIVVTLGVMGAVLSGIITLFGIMATAVGGIKFALFAIKYQLVLMGPLGWAIAAAVVSIGFLTYQVVKYWEDIVWYAKILWKFALGFQKLLWNNILRPFKLWKDIFGVILDDTLSFGEKIKAVGGLLKDYLLAPLKKVQEIWDKIAGSKGFFTANKASKTSTQMRAAALERAGLPPDKPNIRSSRGVTPFENAFARGVPVKVEVVGEIDVNDKTGGMVSTPGGSGGGTVPMNINNGGRGRGGY